jgi:hypothetical protein
MDRLDKIRASVFDYVKDYDRRTDANRKSQTKNLLNYQTPEGILRRKATSERRKKLNEEKYGQGIYTVRSPGNDLLDLYDRQNKLLKGMRRSVIPPSVVFRVRFKTKVPKTVRGANQHEKNITSVIRDICKPFKTTDDVSYWHQVYKTKFDWLVNKKSSSYRFKYRRDALAFLVKKTGQTSISVGIHKNQKGDTPFETMWFRGKARGWSISYSPN